MNVSPLDQGLFAAAVNAMPEDALVSIRKKAASRFTSLGFPTSRDENWKYTNLSPAAEISNAWLQEYIAGTQDSAALGSPSQAELTLLEQTDAHWLVIRNGDIEESSLARIQSECGPDIVIARLAEQMGSSAINVDDSLSAFNAALLQDGLHIRIGTTANLAKPLGILQIDNPSRRTSQTRIVIELEQSSRLQLIECAMSENEGAQFSNSVTQADLRAGSQLDYVRIQCRNTDHMGVNRLIAHLGRDASFNHNIFDVGGSLTRNDTVVNIAGEHARARLHGLYLASGTQHIDNHTRVEHRVGPATSHEEYRGVLNGRSRCVFNGQAVVFEGADGTDANQSNHNLLLSDRAEIDTKPELEIYADDVKCSHGATVGQLDEASVFYLRSRGLDLKAARHLLTQAFAVGVLGDLAIEECREYLADTINIRLSELLNDAHT